MKKNKKLFAILTLVAFMMTLVPALAFAGTVTNTGVTFTVQANGDVKVAATTAGHKVASADTATGDAEADGAESITILAANVQADTKYYGAGAAIDKTTGSDVFTGAVQVDADTKAASAILANADATAQLTAYKGATDAVKTLVDTADNGTLAKKVKDEADKAEQDAINEKVDTNTSVFGAVYQNGGNANVKESVQASVLLADAARNDLDDAKVELTVWAEEVGNPGTPSTALDEVTATTNGGANTVTNTAFNKTGFTIADVTNTTAITLKFARSGEYYIYAALKAADGGATVAEDVKNTTKLSQGYSKVVVNENANDPKKAYTAYVTANGFTPEYLDNHDEVNKLADEKVGYETKEAIKVAANNVGETKVTVKMYNNENRLVGKTVKIDTNSANITTSKTSAVTDSYGQIDFDLSGSREGDYLVYLSCDGFEVRVKVTVGNTSAAYIAVDEQPSAPIALYGDAGDLGIEISLTDINGNMVKADHPNGAMGATYNTTRVGDIATAPQYMVGKYVTFASKPSGTTLKDKDLNLTWDAIDDVYKVTMSNKTFDKEGSYEIKVVLDNGNYVTIPFEVKEFQTPVKLDLSYKQVSIELGGKSTTPTVKYVDANGTTQNAKNKVTLAATGYAVGGFDNDGIITVKNDEKYIGQTITITAVDSRYNLVATLSLIHI